MKPVSSMSTERGAIIIHVAFALLALIAFNVFVVDYGAMWVSRRQAQNAADAGAHAGAVALVRDGGTVASFTLTCPPGSTTPACQAARHWANNNAVFGELNADTNVDVTLSGTGSSIPPCDENPGCVRVDVYRNMPDRSNTGPARGNTIPTFFAPVVGITQQGVRATATAWAVTGDTAECLRPWAVADKWREWRNGDIGGWPGGEKPWEPTDTFDKWFRQGQTVSLYADPRDEYVPHTTSPGTGFTPATDNGLQLVLKLGTGNQNDRISSGWFKALDLPCSSGNQGADCYRENIYGCTTLDYSIGDTITVNSEQGNMVGPTEQGVNGGGPVPAGQGLVEKDPNARWQKDDPNQTYVPGVPQPGRVTNSQYAVSPRIVPVALFNVDEFLATSPNGQSQITISNIMGFFIEGTCGSQMPFPLEPYNSCAQNNGAVVGRLVDYMGLDQGTNDIGNSSFIKVIQLVR